MSQPNSDGSTAILSSTEITVRLACMLTVFGVYGILAVLTTGCMIHRCAYKRVPFLSGRSTPLVVAQALSGTFAGLASLVCTALREYPCALKLWALYVGVLPWLAAITARALQRCVLTLPYPQKALATRQTPRAMSQAYSGPIENIASDLNTIHCGVHGFCVPSRPATGSMTLNTASEMDFPARNSQSTLAGTYDASPVLAIYQPRFGRWVTTKALLTAVAVFGAAMALVALAASVKLHLYQTQAVCPSGGWGAWLAYSVAIAFTGVVFPVLTARMWRAADVYEMRKDIILCMLTAQAAAVLYALWAAVLGSIRAYVSEMFVLWLAMLCSHITSVCVPLWQSYKLHSSMATNKPHKGLTNTYKGSDLRRSLYSSLFSEFCQMMQNKAQREVFLKFTLRYYRSTIPEFLNSFQQLKYKTIEALWQDRLATCCQHHHHHHQRHCQNCCCCRESAETGTRAVSNNALAGGCSCQYNSTQSLGSCPAARLLAQHGQPQTSIQMIADSQQSSHDNHPLATLVPITKGIFESAVAVLPPRSVDQTTQFPEAVKSAFSSFVHTFFGKGSCMSINIPNDIAIQVQTAVDQNNVVLSVLDRAKDEVLFLLCTDVFTGY
ncbi:hypothetical protein EV175_004011, partial [Coemansia sp. RSA 1933]